MSRALLMALVAALSSPAALRPFTPADMFQVEKLGEAVPSPDGRWVAYVRIRGKATAKHHMRDFMNGVDRADVWLASTAGGEPFNLTNGAMGGDGYFLPSWSPDSRRLAMVSTKAQSVTLWLWEAATRKVRQVSATTVEVARPVWLSPTEVLCAGVPEGRQPGVFAMEVRAPETAMRVWPEAWKGETPTASVLRSGPGTAAPRRQGSIWSFNVESQSARVLARGDFSSLTPSPDGRFIAMLEAIDIVRPEPQLLLPNRNPTKYRLVVRSASGDPVASTSPPVEDVVPGSLRWSLGGQLVLQSRTNSRPTDWVTAGGKNLTASFKAPPAALAPTGEDNTFTGVADGHLWLIDAGGSAPRILNPSFQTPVKALVWPDSSTVVVSAGSELYEVELATGVFHLLARPEAGAEFKALSPRTGAAVFSAVTRSGTRLWLCPRGGAARTIASANEFLQQIAEGTLRKIEYRALDGKPLTGWLLLPPDYREGTRCPTVVWVYGGLTFSAEPPPFWVNLSDAGPYGLQLLAARGYAVLLPSMPMQPEGRPSDPYLDFTSGVLPAVDKAIELGIADPQRLAVMGHSYGGYSVYGLVTQTTRFRAAVALAGFCNLVSLYGSIDARARYDDDARDRLLHMVFSESGQFRMGAPPWKDMERYVRNSPLTYAERVTTPLMIVQGDLDYVSMQQGEEFFTALYRQNKPAEFVRYWGEGHIIESPANVSDMWRRIYAWLEQTMPGAQANR